MEDVEKDWRKNALLSMQISPEFCALQQNVNKLLHDKNDMCHFTVEDPCQCCAPLCKKVQEMHGQFLQLESKLSDLAEELCTCKESMSCHTSEEYISDTKDVNYKLSLMEARIGSECMQFENIILQSLGDTWLFCT